MKLIETLDVNNELGEGVIWDHVAGKIWWTDILSQQLFRYDPVSKDLQQWSTPERLCCFAPLENKPGLIAAFESGFAFYDPESGQLDWIEKLEQDNPGTRFNDGRIDRQGRFWAGTMVESDDAPYKGSLYCLHPDLSITKTLTELSITNSLCWSPDSTVMYHTDTPSMQIKQYPFNAQTGAVGSGKLLVETQAGCHPDGSIVDADGYLWNAQWGANQVVRYSPSGEQDLVVNVPTSQPSCAAFAGNNLDLLAVTSAHADMDKDARADDPQAGSLFIYQTGYKGLVERQFSAQ